MMTAMVSADQESDTEDDEFPSVEFDVHESVAASLRLSYELLSASQQEHWRTLSVFPVTFDEAAAAAVWDIKAGAANEVLSELIKFSLMEFDHQKQRYHLHDLAREFARECTNDTERTRFSLRHATHYCAVLSKADDLYQQGNEAVMQGLSLYDQERENILAGQAWAATHGGNNGDEAAARLCMEYPNAGVYVLALRLPTRERIRWLEAQLAAARRLLQREYEGNALGNLGIAYKNLGEPRKAIGVYEQALVIDREIGDRKGEGADLGNLGIAWADLGEPRKAIEFYEQRLVIAREIGDRRGEGNALGNLGNAWADLGETRKAIGFYEQQLVIVREIGDRRGEGNALFNMSLSRDG